MKDIHFAAMELTSPYIEGHMFDYIRLDRRTIKRVVPGSERGKALRVGTDFHQTQDPSSHLSLIISATYFNRSVED